jgi:hypothetical protein
MKFLWHGWDAQERTWKDLLKIQDKTGRSLFFNSSYVNIGNGLNTPFWESKWLHGVSPKEIAPNLFKQIRYKTRSVQHELQNYNWIRNIQFIEIPTLIQEFVMLYVALGSVTLTDQRDEICWKWAASDQFIVASTYEYQFLGAMSPFPAANIWKAKAEPKCRFFAWLAMHDKALTTDNMEKKKLGMQPNLLSLFLSARNNNAYFNAMQFF